MEITGTTTFSQIYNQRTTEGGSLQDVEGGKHLRFKGDDLYTHDSTKTHSLNFIERAKKHQEAVKTIKASIDRELGPGQGDFLFKQLGLSSKKITVDQLQLIHGEVEYLKSIAPFVPKDMSLTLTPSGNYEGQAELTWNDDHVTEMRTLMDESKNAKLSEQGPVTEQFMKDVNRDTIKLHGGPPKSDEDLLREENLRILNNRLEASGLPLVGPKDGGDQEPPKLTSDTAIEDLKTYTGGDNKVCENLSRFLQQDMWSSVMTRVYRLENQDGHGIKPYVDLSNCERSYDVYKDGNDFVIDFHWHSPIKGFSDVNTGSQLLSEQGQTLDMTMQLKLSRDDLANGVLNNYEITKGPNAMLSLAYTGQDTFIN